MENEAIFNGDCILTWRSIGNETPSFSSRFVLFCFFRYGLLKLLGTNGQKQTTYSAKRESCDGEFISEARFYLVTTPPPMNKKVNQ